MGECLSFLSGDLLDLIGVDSAIYDDCGIVEVGL